MDVTWSRGLWYPSGPQQGLVTLVLNWASPGPSEYAPSGPHLDLVTLVPTWASSGHGSPAWPAGWPHLGLVTLVPTWASSGHGSTAWPLGGPHPELVPLVPTWASSGRVYSIPSGTDLIVVTLVLTFGFLCHVTLAPPGPHL